MLTLDYKLDGDLAQYVTIDAGIRVVQFLRNKCLRAWMDRADVGQSFAAMSAYTAVLAKEFAFAEKLGSQARQAAAERAWTAIQRFYDNCKKKAPGKKGYPQFKHNSRSIEYEVAGWQLESSGKHLTCSNGLGIGMLRLIGARSVGTFPEQQIKRLHIVRRADGYYVQFCVDVERHVAYIPTGKQTGIDVGLHAFYADSDGNTVDHPRHYRKAEQKLKKLGKRFSRTRKGSSNRKKFRTTLAKQHLKVKRQREDSARKAACALVTSTDLIAFEDLQVRNLVRNHHFAKSISDAGWSQFLGWVRYYATMHGIAWVAVPPAYMSQHCSGCHRMVKKSLSVRTHCCPYCGLVLDRDVNAGLNILQEALRILGHRTTATAGP